MRSPRKQDEDKPPGTQHHPLLGCRLCCPASLPAPWTPLAPRPVSSVPRLPAPVGRGEEGPPLPSGWGSVGVVGCLPPCLSGRDPLLPIWRCPLWS